VEYRHGPGVNQFLLDRVGFSGNRSPGWRQFLSTAVTFENLGWPDSATTRNGTAEEAYKLLEANLPQVQAAGTKLRVCDDHLWNEGDGGSQEKADASSENSRQRHRDRIKNEKDGVDDEFDDLEELLKQIFTHWMPGWSSQGSGEIRQVLGEDLPEVDWERILVRRIQARCNWVLSSAGLHPIGKSRGCFRRCCCHRIASWKTGCFRPAGSGRVWEHFPETLGRFMAMARTIPPDRADLTLIVFDTVAYETDLTQSLRGVPGGAALPFSALKITQRLIGVSRADCRVDGRACSEAVRPPARAMVLADH